MREVEGPSKVELPLSVVFSNKMRLVVDASRHLNPYVEMEKTKLDSLDDLTCLVERGEWCSVDDFDSGYWHVPLHESMFEYCGCHLTDPVTGVTRYFQWMVLFLGVSSAVSIFTEVLHPVVKYLPAGVNIHF